MKKLIKEYFSFTKRERIAIIGLMVVILVAYVLPYFIKPAGRAPSARELQEFRTMEQQLAKADNNNKAESNDIKADDGDEYTVAHAPPPAKLFYFDPNTISPKGWEQLGLRSKTIGTILKYLSKGGRFYTAPDLKKIYGLRAEDYARLERYVRIDKPGKKDEIKTATAIKNHYQPPAKHTIDINTADTTDWINLPGIGSKLAVRIVTFREKLGGFHDIEQIRETYGLPDSTFQKILPLLTKGTHPIKKININTTTLETLKQHPYIRWSLASAIIRYREQHGPFSTLESLQQIAVITPAVYSKLLPYLDLSD